MTNTEAASPLSSWIARIGEDVAAERLASHDFRDWSDPELAREFSECLASVRVWAQGPREVHCAVFLSEDAAGSHVPSEVLDGACARLPAPFLDSLARLHGSELRIESLAPGHGVMYLW